ncbi:hypothetical protein VH1709_contig00039-0007 [Vibrio harveyi]|uniref:antirestriction protein n=1 Tax=Vibrio harveyi TaxID=669 RepID=UPI000D78A352|nr:antirestriction protein [Vibrio harveyi]GBK99851.1 hypothetical protein VH1709_contig00039-0007 [Vibrio harveyi]
MITASTVPLQERLSFYPSITSEFTSLEMSVYHYSDLFLTDYSGGYWEFVTLSNGGKFAYPEMDDPINFDNTYNQTSEILSKEAAGICIWLIILGNCAMSAYQNGNRAELDNLSQYQVLLMEYAIEHEEWDKISRLID